MTFDAPAYDQRRDQIETYFDRTAFDAWARLTSDAPVSKIRATVRAGRDRMRAALLSWLPQDLSGMRTLDAGCGAGDAAAVMAARGAEVLAIDIAENLIALARDRAAQPGRGRVQFMVGDMADAAHGGFDHVLAMDSLIHYPRSEVVSVLAGLAQRTRRSIVFTFAPRTPALTVMHAAGRLMPRGDRAPSIEPMAESFLRRAVARMPAFAGWRIERSERVTSGFYISNAMELVRA
ncbi:MAG: magnesium protoporphyrin IX methyltransferase [Alphaproteobacteria bacterium]|nr:magnesium protoporphyrin IX methyltransferase [Alphaproteobacteria bacterium]